MKMYIDRFMAKAFKVSSIRLNEGDVVADEKFHLVDGKHFYVLSAVKPPVGFFGHIDCIKPEKWALKRKTAKDKTAYEKKCKALSEAVNQGLGSLRGGHQTLLPSVPDNSGDEAVVKRLSCLTSCEYDRVRKHEAAKLGVRVSTLDKSVDKARKSRGPGRLSPAHAQLEFEL